LPITRYPFENYGLKNGLRAIIYGDFNQNYKVNLRFSYLWIATDQEGGIVSRLSPPLTQLPQLSKIVDEKKTIEQNQDVVVNYAQTQGRELSELGINLNFAPVVDLNKGSDISFNKCRKNRGIG
jgi:beta-glucosidase-like glycosyl hydrolase